MKDKELVRDVHRASLPRRDFLRKSILLTLPVMGAALPASAAVYMGAALPSLSNVYVPPKRARGTRVLNVRNYGALGNGSSDDTTAFQNAVNALPSDGGTVYVPAGSYVIDPTRNVRLRGRMHLQLAEGAKLIAKSNAAERAYVLMVYKVSDVEISGGQIVGDRDRHQGTAGEWGHGIMIRGSSRVTVRDIHISKCWGDGISIGGAMVTNQPSIPCNDVAIANVVCTANRRQGLTIGRSSNVRVYDSEFSNTSGAAPACGVNVEPDDGGGTYSVHIQNCLVRGNQGNGIQTYKRVEGVTIKLNQIENNTGYGVLAIGAKGGFIALNHIRSNGLIGVGMRSSASNYQLSENRFYNNAKRFRSGDTTYFAPPAARVGNVLERHTEVTSSTSDIRITTNFYYDD